MSEQQWALSRVWLVQHALLISAFRINLDGESQQEFHILENPIILFQNTNEGYLFHIFFLLDWCHITEFQ